MTLRSLPLQMKKVVLRKREDKDRWEITCDQMEKVISTKKWNRVAYVSFNFFFFYPWNYHIVLCFFYYINFPRCEIHAYFFNWKSITIRISFSQNSLGFLFKKCVGIYPGFERLGSVFELLVFLNLATVFQPKEIPSILADFRTI